MVYFKENFVFRRFQGDPSFHLPGATTFSWRGGEGGGDGEYSC